VPVAASKVSLSYPSHVPVAALLMSPSPLPHHCSQCEYAQTIEKMDTLVSLEIECQMDLKRGNDK